MNPENQDWNRKLFLSIGDEDIRLLKISLNNGADLHSKRGYDMSTPLQFAIRNNFMDGVKVLISRGADINEVYNDVHHTPLTWSIFTLKYSYHNIQICSYLIKIGANVCKKEEQGKTPLLWAVLEKEKRLIKLLLDHGAKFTVQSAFLEAIETGDLEIVQMLIKNDADVNFCYENGYTPLLKAIEVANLPVVWELVTNGADVNKPGINGKKPITQSLSMDNAEIVRLLIENGAEVNSVSSLIKAIEMGNLELVMKITEHKVDVNAKDDKGNLPVLTAIEARNLDIVKHLVENGASLEITDKRGKTPFQKALYMEDLELVKYLVGRGENVNSRDTKGETPLSIAAKNLDFRTFDFLIKSGAKIDDSVEGIKKIARNNNDFALYLKSLKRDGTANQNDEDQGDDSE